MPMWLEELGRDVYACMQEEKGLGTSNSGLVNRGGGLVVDTFWDLPHTRDMIAQYARVWRAPARRVVNTHHNGDHAWGNQLFPDAELIGHRRCAEAFGRERPEMMQMLRNQAGSDSPVLRALAAKLADWDFTGVMPTPPTTLIDDRLDLDLDGIRIELRWVGPAHTAGDVIAWLPKERIVFTGDVLFRLCTPIGWDGTFDGWIAALDAIVALDPKVVVPGHGPLCGVEGPREMREYLAYVRAECGKLFAAGVPAIEAAKKIDLGPYAAWTEPERIVFQVERAYREIQGVAYDAPLDVNLLFAGMYEVRQAIDARHAH